MRNTELSTTTPAALNISGRAWLWVTQLKKNATNFEDYQLTTRKSYGFRSFDLLEIALYQGLSDLPEPNITHRFCGRAGKFYRNVRLLLKKSRSLSMVKVMNNNRKESDRDGTRNSYNTSV